MTRDRFASVLAVVVCVVAISAQTTRAAVVIDFDSHPEGVDLSTEYSGLGASFSGAEIVTQGSNLSSLYPPVSGTNVVFNYLNSGVIRVDSVGPDWSSAGGYITGNVSITLTAFASDNSVLGAVATGGANYIGAGSPNIFLSVAAPNISYVTFSDHSNTFTLDNFTFQPNAAGVPEQSSFFCWAIVLTVGAVIAVRRSSN
jgi:hypothetical protein